MISGHRLRMLLLASAILTGCDGENLFQKLPTGSGSGTDAPNVSIEAPTAGQRVAIGDSVRVQVRVSDGDGLWSLELSGFAVRGDASLGTDERVARYESKLVQFDLTRMVSDTLLTRYLLATDDSLPDASVYVVARATDRSGNVAADTVVISIS